MTDIAIRAEKLSKQYRIGGKQAEYQTLRDILARSFTSPFRRLSSVVRGRPIAPSHETIWALKDVSFEVKRGDALGIIGRNGAGKSTLLKILSRITEPTEGKAEVRGRVGSLLEVGTGFHQELTGRENIYLNGAILGMKKAEIESKFDEIVAFAEIEKFIDTPVKHYSSGMHMRLAFSVAAHLEPDILLVDEVLAVGDIDFQRKCIRKMGDISGKGRTVLIVSHNMRVVETLAHRCLYLNRGVLEGHGPVLDIIRQYQKDSFGTPAYGDLPAHFDTDIVEPKATIQNLALYNNNGYPTNVVAPGNSICLSFDMEVNDDISEAVVCVYFCKDKLIVSGNNSDHVIGGLSFQKGQKLRLEINYESISLIPGEYIVLVFVLPSYFSEPTDSLSEFYTVKLIVEGSRIHGGGYVCLRQNWKITNILSENGSYYREN